MTLCEYLEQPAVTASNLARRVGVAHTTILRWANGSICPNSQRLNRLHEATDGKVAPNDFLTRQAA